MKQETDLLTDQIILNNRTAIWFLSIGHLKGFSRASARY